MNSNYPPTRSRPPPVSLALKVKGGVLIRPRQLIHILSWLISSDNHLFFSFLPGSIYLLVHAGYQSYKCSSPCLEMHHVDHWGPSESLRHPPTLYCQYLLEQKRTKPKYKYTNPVRNFCMQMLPPPACDSNCATQL